MRSLQPSDSPRSREISTKVGVDSALRNMIVKGGSQRQDTLMGLRNAVVCLPVVLSTPMNMFWRCEPPFTTMFRVQRRVNVTRNKKQESAD